MKRLKLLIKDKIWETPEACTFYFENLTGETIFYKAGQFLTIILDLDGAEVLRTYSLCTVSIKDKFPGITVKKVSNGLVSNYLVNNLKEGDVIESLYPSGIFTTEFSSKNSKEYFLLAVGSGITPLFSILQSILQKEPHSIIHLIYSSRNESTIIYKSKLEELEIRNLDRLKVIHVLSKPSEDWHGFNKRVDEDLLTNLIQELSEKEKSEALFFLCGPSDYMSMAEGVIQKLGYDPDKIKKESFFSLPAIAANIDRNGLKPIVKLLFKSQEYEFQLDEGQSILDGALENNIGIPHSCTSGVCTACIGTCLEGVVDFSSSDALSENEKKQGYVLTCVGVPTTQKVTIQID